MGALMVYNGSTWEYASQAQSPSESYVAACSAATGIATTTATDITGMTVTLVSPGPTAVYMVDVSLDLQQTAVGSPTFIGNLVIDGAAQSATIINTTGVNGFRSTVSKRWRITGLTAGSHTFKVQGSLLANLASAYSVNNIHSVMEVNRTAAPGLGEGVLSTEYINTQPASPSAGVVLFSRTRARRMPAFVGPTGQDNRLQPSMAFNTICAVNALNNSGTPDLQTIAVTHLNNAGSTVTAVPIATTNLFTSVPRYRCATTTVAGTGAGTRSTQAQWMLSSTVNKGGLHFVCRFGFNLISSVSRAFVGMSTTTTVLSAGADPSSFLNLFGFGFDLADTNLQFMSNDGSGVATKVNTGMAKGTGGTDFYEVELFAPSAGGQQVWYAIRRLNDETIFRGSSAVVTDLPALDTLLSFHVHLSNGTAVAAHSIDIKSIYIESDV